MAATLQEAILQALATPQYMQPRLNDQIAASAAQWAPNVVDLRANGIPKGTGFFGVLNRPGGGVSTELSTGVDFGQGETQIPTLVPTLNSDEINYLLSNSPQNRLPRNILDKSVEFAKQRMAQGLSPFAQPNEIPYGIAQSQKESALGRFPVRQPYASELDYFTKNPGVAGMATEDNAVIINPNNAGMRNPQQRNAVIQNEGIRLLINSIPQKPAFEITPEQRTAFKGTVYANDEQKMRETIAARIFSGDPSAKTPTAEQLQYVDFLKQQISK